MPADRSARLVAVPEEADHREPLARVPDALPEQERRHTAHTTSGPRFLQLSTRLGLLVGLVDVLRRRGGRARCPLRHVDGHHRAPGRDRARQRGGGARARARRRLDLRQRRRRARRRGALRAARRRSRWLSRSASSSGARSASRSTGCSSTSARSRSRRSPRPRSSCSGIDGGLGRARHGRGGPRRRRGLLRGQHRSALGRARGRGP